MRRLLAVLAPSLTVLALMSPLGHTAPFGPPVGGPMRMMPPPGGVMSAEHRDPELDALAGRPDRPSWAPLPMLLGQVTVVPPLHELLGSDEAAERARAAFLLGQIGCPSSRTLLARNLTDADRTVRVHCGLALALMDDQRGRPVCATVIRSDPAWLRYYAVLGLWRLQELDLLRRVQDGQPELVARAIAGALQDPPAAAPVPHLGETSVRWGEDSPCESCPEEEASGARQWPELGASLFDTERTQGSASARPALTPSPQQIWQEAADVFTRESDWWWHQGDYEQAIRCHEAAILLDPTYVEDYAVVAWLQWSLGRDREAVATLIRGTLAAPGDPEAHFALGQHYYNTNRFLHAVGPLRKAAELGGDPLSVRLYAHCLERLGRLHQSLAQWAKLLKSHPEDAAAQRNYDRVRQLIQDRSG